MAQIILWNWQDDDSSALLNLRMAAFFPSGVYHGFDAVLPASMLLELSMANGKTVTLTDKTQATYGYIRTPQSVDILEDASIQLAINPNALGNARIDAIYLEHEYVFTQNGSVGIYQVAQGTPSANPVAPALPNPHINTLIGYLYLPDNTTALNQPGVIWTKSGVPSFASDPTIMHTNKVQTSTALKTFNHIRLPHQEATYVNTGAFSGNLVLANESNNYWIAGGGSSLYTYVTSIVASFAPQHGQDFELFSERPMVLYAFSGNLRLPVGMLFMAVEPGETIKFKDITDYDGTSTGTIYLVSKGDEARTGRNNKFFYLNQFNKVSSAVQPTSGGNVALTRFGNFHDINVSVRKDIKFLPSFNQGRISGGPEAGTFIFVRLTGSNGTIYHNAPSVPGGYKPILLPNGSDQAYRDGGLLTLIEDYDGWRVLSYVDTTNNPFNPYDTLNELTDVDISIGLAAGQVLYYTGFTWVNLSLENLIRNTARTFAAAQAFSAAVTINAGINYGFGAFAEKRIAIGAWDMDAQTTKDIAHGLDFSKIEAVIDVMVVNDNNDRKYSLRTSGDWEVRPTEIRLVRLGAGQFDGVDYNNTGINRGYIHIKYQV